MQHTQPGGSSGKRSWIVCDHITMELCSLMLCPRYLRYDLIFTSTAAQEYSLSGSACQDEANMGPQHIRSGNENNYRKLS